MMYAFSASIWVAGLFAPEAIVGWAVSQLSDVSDDVQAMRHHGCPQWRYKHAFFAQMGGLRSKDGKVIRSGDELYNLHVSYPSHVSSGDSNAMATFDFQALADDIDDKSKANWFAKLIAVLQITRFLCGTVVRAAKHLPISPLEYVTCAYVVCTLLSYVFWFHKPYDVQEPIRIEIGVTYVLGPDSEPSPADSDTILGKCESTYAVEYYMLTFRQAVPILV